MFSSRRRVVLWIFTRKQITLRITISDIQQFLRLALNVKVEINLALRDCFEFIK